MLEKPVDTCAAIVGANWGDEGKGRMVDLLAAHYDVVVRYQGGGNAGHTVVNDYGTFALHLLPSGIFNDGVINVLGNGVALNAEQLFGEIDTLKDQGVDVTPDNLVISERASLLLPWHRDLDNLEEARLADKQYGSTRQGIAPFYSDKFQKKTILAGELRDPQRLEAHVADILEWKNLTLTQVYGAEPATLSEVMEWINTWAMRLVPYLANTAHVLAQAKQAGKRILFEAQLGALRDIDFGIHPFTTSSNTIAAYAPVGSGLPSLNIDRVIAVVKAYSTCVGAGPFTCEWFGEKADRLRDAGGEYGATTGRPRRVGPLDLVATRYGIQMQGASEIALTKMDVLSDMDEIPVCVAYDLPSGKTENFPFPADLEAAKPVEIMLPGWKSDISGCRTWEELPQQARDYVEYVEKQLDCHIRYVSVGPEREAYIVR
ncbi:adenylosuccinate synthase [Arcanobacterium pinnipediorum]|uniref:Adenylosuccinate synthetase n=1 Tax=Arcanobacterium pinnipediorum TaxID=1503041 RepID=A0ABY5AFB8_9ACTO|nr:adenylosuccinate synthase [Arcanobacterium pinnipediorum]USR78917.1 adenylosuccinate synthase [Arcanobacterium pinnipediorum]